MMRMRSARYQLIILRETRVALQSKVSAAERKSFGVGSGDQILNRNSYL